jgi:hypothetical protein
MKDAVRLPRERKPLGELQVRMAQRLLLDASKTPGWAGGGGPTSLPRKPWRPLQLQPEGTG